MPLLTLSPFSPSLDPIVRAGEYAWAGCGAPAAGSKDDFEARGRREASVAIARDRGNLLTDDITCS